MSTAQYPARARVAAWAVHILTMSGLVWASLAMLATINPRREFTWMWVWLLVALVVDGVDGTLARRAKVSEIIPWFDGGIVDIVVDYLTWTFIPAVFMYVALPMGPRPLAGLLMALVLSSSMFCYANKQWKSTDYYFVGFPAAWNIVALMFYVLQTPAVFNIIVTLIFVVLTLVPTHYAHPARVKRFRALNIGAVAVWFLATCWLVAIYPHRPSAWSPLSSSPAGGSCSPGSCDRSVVLSRRRRAPVPTPSGAAAGAASGRCPVRTAATHHEAGGRFLARRGSLSRPGRADLGRPPRPAASARPRAGQWPAPGR